MSCWYLNLDKSQFKELLDNPCARSLCSTARTAVINIRDNINTNYQTGTTRHSPPTGARDNVTRNEALLGWGAQCELTPGNIYDQLVWQSIGSSSVLTLLVH